MKGQIHTDVQCSHMYVCMYIHMYYIRTYSAYIQCGCEIVKCCGMNITVAKKFQRAHIAAN